MAFLVLDEAERGEFLGVGGLIVPVSRVCELETRWQGLKENYGLPRDAFLKWSPEDDVVQVLRRTGRDVPDVRRRVCEWIGRCDDIMVVGVVLQERRPDALRPGKGGVRDFYKTGVAFCVQRFARVVEERPEYGAGPHLLVVDSVAWSRGRKSPVLSDKVKRLLEKLWGGRRRSILGWMAKGHQALLREYRDWYWDGFGELKIGALGGMGFMSSWLEAHSRYMDLLQMADFVAGAFVELFSRCEVGGPVEVVRDCVKALLPVVGEIRGFGSGIWGGGIVLYPPNRELWRKVQRELL
jgi:hypothetical protein